MEGNARTRFTPKQKAAAVDGPCRRSSPLLFSEATVEQRHNRTRLARLRHLLKRN